MQKPFYKKTNLLILFALSVLLILRFSFPNTTETVSTSKEDNSEKALRHVRMETINSEKFEHEIRIFSETIPIKKTDLISKYNGDISKIFIKEGDFVKEGQKIIEIKDNGLEDSLKSANLALEEQVLKIEASKSLKSKGLISQLEFINAQTEYKKALSNQVSASKNFDDSFITANFSGYIEDFDWNVGDYVEESQIIASLNDLSQIKTYLKIPENYIEYIDLNSKVYFKFKDYNLDAKFTFLSKVGNLNTHTFDAKILSKKQDNLKSGLSLPVFVSLGNKKAFNVSLSLITKHKGYLNLKTVENNIVKNIPIEIITNSEKGVWISGLNTELPESLDIITIGHLLVLEGDTVKSSFVEKE
jgi:multidrug efflux system membrane fusion protein